MPNDQNYPVASEQHHKALIDAGYAFERTSTTTYTDRAETNTGYARKAKAAKGDMISCGDSDTVSVTTNSISSEPIWRRSWYDGKGQWQDMSGSSVDALKKAVAL